MVIRKLPRPILIETDEDELFNILWVLQHGHPDNAYNQIAGTVEDWTDKLINAGIKQGCPDRPGVVKPVQQEARH